jgi:NAD(P)-dependent dehydrogenase (short-subunit alcohol dehydrogenase family)
MHALGRMGTPEEASSLVCVLLSDAASFITGSRHPVDGGFTARQTLASGLRRRTRLNLGETVS